MPNRTPFTLSFNSAEKFAVGARTAYLSFSSYLRLPEATPWMHPANDASVAVLVPAVTDPMHALVFQRADMLEGCQKGSVDEPACRLKVSPRTRDTIKRERGLDA